MTTEAAIRVKFRALASRLDEHTRRVWAATEANSIGYGGVSMVARATGISRRAIAVGLREIEEGDILPEGRVRRQGGGRKSGVHHQPDLPEILEGLVEPLTRGDPMSPLRWTCKSTRRLSMELTKLGYSASSRLVGVLLHEMGYSLQGNRKTIEGKQHPDRNAQFEYINTRVTAQMRAAQPVISVDTKKKELIGNYKNGGCEWHRKGEAPKVNGHDFPNPDVPRAHPYGVYDLARKRGFVNVGTDHDTGTFAVASIRKWWLDQGRRAYPKAKRLLITADAGGSNGSRLRLWKWELQRLADELRFPMSVCHFPPGTSKWNKVEHRLFSFISSNWRGEPLADYATVVNLIAKTTTTTGLKVSCRLDRRRYPTGRRISDAQFAEINLHRDDFHGDWNGCSPIFGCVPAYVSALFSGFYAPTGQLALSGYFGFSDAVEFRKGDAGGGQQLGLVVAGFGNAAADELASEQHVGCTKMRQRRDAFLDRQVQVTPAATQLADDRVSQHDHQGVAFGAVGSAEVHGPEFQVDGLADPERLLHRSQVFIAGVQRSGTSQLLINVRLENITTVELGLLSQGVGVLDK